MPFLLSSQNIFEYLTSHGLCTQEDRTLGEIELKSAKNFNLLLNLPGARQLLVKQEPYNPDGKTSGEFLREWRVQEFLQRFPELEHLRCWLPEVLNFDPENSIIVFRYLTNYRDLADFYIKENIFPIVVARSVGVMLATLHRSTLDRLDYRDFFSQNSDDAANNQVAKLIRGLERIGPEVYAQVPPEGLKFFALYQRYDSLGKATVELSKAFEPCCLTHNDLKLNNILLPLDWEQATSTTLQPSGGSVGLRLIDWERSTWGDPAFDLGSALASYLGIWLGSLIVSKSITIDESLRLATTPLELLQPSLAALTGAYLDRFPEILERRPDFLQRAIQFSGLALIQAIQSMIQYQKSFNNMGICMLQVAKALLCCPEASAATVLGPAASELTRLSYAPA